MRTPGLLALLALLAPLTLAACAEAPPVVPPQPAPPPVVAAPASTDPAPVTEGDMTVAFAGGMKIIIKRIPGAELSALRLYIKGGVRNGPAEVAGVERLGLNVAVAGGTTTLDKDAFARRLAVLGSDVSAEARPDFSMVRAGCLGSAWDDTFTLLADAFLQPALPPAEIELQRQRQLATIRHELENPESQLGAVTHDVLFKGHPFEQRSIGTLETVQHLDLAALKARLAQLRQAGRLVFITVGDVEPAHVIERVRATFGALPAAPPDLPPVARLAFDKANVSVTERKIPTNYIQGLFPAPGWRDPDQAEAMVAMNVLRFRVFEEVRTKRNLSYAPNAGLSQNLTTPLGFISVSAVDPGKTIKVMLDEARKLRDEPVSAQDLAGTKATYLTNYLMQNEAVDGQAGLLGEAELLGGDWHLGRTLPERMRAVTAAGVQAYARKYMQRFQFVVVGDPAKIDKALFGSL
jgi:predicted Zn-dependent peptidase